MKLDISGREIQCPRQLILAALAAAVLFAAPAHAEGDAAKGEKVFAKCKACHENREGREQGRPDAEGRRRPQGRLRRRTTSIPKP